MNLKSFPRLGVYYRSFISKDIGENNKNNFVLYHNYLFISGNAIIPYYPFIDTFTKYFLSFLSTQNSIEITPKKKTKKTHWFLKYRITPCKCFAFLLFDILSCYYSAEELLQVHIPSVIQVWLTAVKKESTRQGSNGNRGGSMAVVLRRHLAPCFSSMHQEERAACYIASAD